MFLQKLFNSIFIQPPLSINSLDINKVVVYKFCGELFLIVQCITYTFGPSQSCNFNLFKHLRLPIMVACPAVLLRIAGAADRQACYDVHDVNKLLDF